MQYTQLFELVYRIKRRLSKRMAFLHHREGLAETDLAVLYVMNRKQVCRVSELGEIGISPSTLTGTLDRLVIRGLLERVPDPGDRRGILMKYTPEASALMQRLMTTINEELANIFKILPEGRMQEMIADFELIIDYLEHDQR